IDVFIIVLLRVVQRAGDALHPVVSHRLAVCDVPLCTPGSEPGTEWMGRIGLFLRPLRWVPPGPRSPPGLRSPPGPCPAHVVPHDTTRQSAQRPPSFRAELDAMVAGRGVGDRIAALMRLDGAVTIDRPHRD